MEETEKRPQFGNRYLTEDDDVFKHNAWDDVQWDEEQEQEARTKVEANAKITLTKDEIDRLEECAAEKWDNFYGIHQNRFFKDRNWLFTEFPDLKSASTILELGCGVGNTVVPILETNTNPDLMFYCSDFSPKAIEILKEHPEYSKGRCEAFVLDITKADWTDDMPIGENSIDVIILVFVLSALKPDTMKTAVANMYKYLKPGGTVVFRDYGQYDMAQLRFKQGRCLGENFYTRGDGTRCFFFSQEFIRTLFVDEGFKEVQNRVDRRLQVNRGKKLKMYRIWMQAKYTK